MKKQKYNSKKLGTITNLFYFCTPKFLINLRYEKEKPEHFFYQHTGNMHHGRLRQPR